MFKLLLVLSIILYGYAIYKVVIDVTKQSTPRQPNETLNIDDVIEELEFKITRVEIQAEKGIKSAEETLRYLKIDLEKARNLKNKINK